MKISLGLPTNRHFQPKTSQCLLELVANSNYEWDIILAIEGYSIAENRNYIAVKALNNKSEYLLMIDDDMVFPPDTLDKLMSNKKDICGVAFHPRCETDKMKILDETHWSKIKKDEVFESKAIGTGIILIKCNIFYNIPRPWFFFTWHETGQCKNGEDWNFCFKAKDKGYKIYCDPTIPVGHIGSKVY